MHLAFKNSFLAFLRSKPCSFIFEAFGFQIIFPKPHSPISWFFLHNFTWCSISKFKDFSFPLMSWSFTFRIHAYYSHIASQFMNFPLFVNLVLHFIEYMHLLCFWSARKTWFAHWTSKVADFSIIFDFESLTLVDYFILTARLW